jgi:hypothetical protein
MELKFTEMYDDEYNNNNNSNNSNTVDNSSTNYWENNYNNRATTTTTTSKNKVTYDDILSSLNLVVSPNGVLQYMRVNKNNLPCNNSSSSSCSSSSLHNTSSKSKSNNNVNSKSVYVQPNANATIEPQLKHSYIYNKFFKDYKDNTIVEEPRQPMTREEYKKMIIEEQIKIRQARERAAMVKSTKMLFTNNNNNHISTPINVNRNQLNRLFRVNR